jgi:hypothetical protein
MNSSGKVLTIFLVIIAILLISITALALFFHQKETERRKFAETSIEEFRAEKTKIEEELKEVKKQNFLLQEKQKEAEARVNDLSEELELEKGLREEIKLEAASLKGQLEEAVKAKEVITKETQAKEELQKKLTAELLSSEQKVKELEAQLNVEVRRGQKLSQLYEQKQGEVFQAETAQASPESPVAQTTQPKAVTDIDSEGDMAGRILNHGVELEEIVVVPGDSQEIEPVVVVPTTPPRETEGAVDILEGRVLSVDAETEFVIVNIGKEDGVQAGNVFSVYRDADYLGDIKITRLQAEMAAADLIAPFVISNIRKDDQVKLK